MRIATALVASLLTCPAVHAAVMKASWYDAPSRASFASRHKDWRGRCFTISRGSKRVHAVCRDYGPQAWTGRGIDVSRDVATRLGFRSKGLATVNVTPCQKHHAARRSRHPP